MLTSRVRFSIATLVDRAMQFSSMRNGMYQAEEEEDDDDYDDNDE